MRSDSSAASATSFCPLGSIAAERLQSRRTLWGREAILGLLVVVLLVGGARPVISPPDSQSSGNLPAQSTPAFFFWFVFVGPTSCYLATGVCTTTIVNTGTNSSYDLQALGCQMDVITYSNPQVGVSQYSSLYGDVGGFVTVSFGQGEVLQRLPFGAVVNATCAIPPADLTSEPSSQPATGSFQMELVNSLGSLSPGKSAGVSFAGTWTASPTTTVTSVITSNATVTSTSTVTSTATTTATSTSTATTTLTTTGGLPSQLPYQLVLVVLVVGLVAVSYRNVRRRPVG